MFFAVFRFLSDMQQHLLTLGSLYGLTTIHTILYFYKSWSSDSWSLETYVRHTSHIPIVKCI